jgi:hypothetical protein
MSGRRKKQQDELNSSSLTSNRVEDNSFNLTEEVL